MHNRDWTVYSLWLAAQRCVGSSCALMSIRDAGLERQRALSLLVLWALGAWSSMAEPRASNEVVSLQLKWHHQFQFAGYYAAQARQFYREEGLDVRIIEGDAQHPPVQEVLAGRAQYGVNDADLLKAYLDGKPVVALAVIFQHSPYVLMTRADRNVRTVADLRGKTIMISGVQETAQLKAMLRREGMSLQDVRLVAQQWDLDSLIDGEVDALSAYSTAAPFRLKAKGIEPGLIRAIDYGVDFYGDTLFTTAEELQRYPTRVAAFRRASIRGWEYAMAHTEEIIDLILQLPGTAQRGTTREMLRYEAAAMHPLLGFVEPGEMNPGRWQAMARTYADLGVIARTPSEVQLRNFVYTPATPNHEAWIKPLLIGVGALALLAGWGLLWNVQLRKAVARRTAALQLAQQQLSYHVENSPLAVIEWDKDFRVVRWTGQAEQVFGWSADELLGKHPSEWHFVHDEDRALGDQVMFKLITGQERRNFCRNRNYRRDGSVVECEWYNSGSLDEQGNLKSILSLVLDVTARAHAAAALRKSEAMFRAIFEQAAIGMGRMGFADARWTDVNEAFCRMLGYSAEEMRSTPWTEITHPEDIDMDRVALGRIAAGELGSYTVEKRFLHKRGHYVWARLTVSAVRGPDGRPDYKIAIIENITDRKQAEEALRENEQQFRALAESVPQLVWTADADGMVNYVNERWCAYTGQTQAQAMGLGWCRAIHDEDRARVRESWAVVVRSGNSYEVEYRLRGKDGQYRWFLARGMSLGDPHGQIHRWFGTSTDIHEQKRTVQALQASERRLSHAKEELARINSDLDLKVQDRTARLRETLSDLEGFSYSLIHDMRAPLRAMEGYASILEQESGDRLPPASLDYLRKIRLAADRMDQLIVDSLNYSKVLREELPLQPVEVGNLLRGLVETYPNFQPPVAEVKVEIDTLWVSGNRAALTQVFSNLLANAVKFVAPGVRPQVRVWAQRFEGGRSDKGKKSEPLQSAPANVRPLNSATPTAPSGQPPSPSVLVWVEDNGIGIPADAQEKIFGMFQRLHRTDQYPGTGIGLAIVRKSLERIGGQVCLDSEPGKGSRFCVELPLVPPSAGLQQTDHAA